MLGEESDRVSRFRVFRRSLIPLGEIWLSGDLDMGRESLCVGIVISSTFECLIVTLLTLKKMRGKNPKIYTNLQKVG